MKTDPIFYRLFQAVPGSFFELIGQSATEARAYQFASVELKQTAFRIDGLFLPLPEAGDRPIYFVEVRSVEIDDLKQTRFYQEVLQEGREEGRAEGELRGKLAALPLLLQVGMSVEQIAEQLGVDLTDGLG